MFQFGEELRCQAYLAYAKALAKINKIDLSKELIGEAISEWTGTPEEVNVLMANSEIMVHTGEIKKAINVLKTVEKESHMYAQSRKLMADIYLK